ncbi:MAG: 3-dehydroquinate synthase [Chloroflexia bacterium]
MRVVAEEIDASSLEVRTPDGGYSILLGCGLLDRLGELATGHGLGRKVVVATDTNVAPLYGEQVMAALRARDFDTSIAAMCAGEVHKGWASVSMFVDEFAHVGLARDGWVLALGGGVVGDTAGFAASIYMRGVPLVQIPTTLLAMADSSIGGKVGIDHPAGKNLVGAFKQPEFVIADLDVLATLSPIQISCGMAEIIKAAIIADPDLFSYLELIEPDELDYDFTLMRAMKVKRRIVETDPFEKGERANLNLGHTFGHAFESCTEYARPHGLAVAQGMVVAFNLAARLGMCDSAEEARLEKLLNKWGLPCGWGEPDLADEDAAKRVYTAMAADKKRRDGLIRLVLPEAIDKVALVSGTPQQLVFEALVQTQ